jgi:hypothetical protein
MRIRLPKFSAPSKRDYAAVCLMGIIGSGIMLMASRPWHAASLAGMAVIFFFKARRCTTKS